MVNCPSCDLPDPDNNPYCFCRISGQWDASSDETPNLFLLRPNKVDHHRIEEMCDWYRASGDCTCARCGHLYYDHPRVIGWTWLRRICNGDLVKL